MSTKRNRDAFMRGVRSVIDLKTLGPTDLRGFRNAAVHLHKDVNIRVYDDLLRAWQDTGCHIRKAMDEQPEQPRTRKARSGGDLELDYCS